MSEFTDTCEVIPAVARKKASIVKGAFFLSRRQLEEYCSLALRQYIFLFIWEGKWRRPGYQSRHPAIVKVSNETIGAALRVGVDKLIQLKTYIITLIQPPEVSQAGQEIECTEGPTLLSCSSIYNYLRLNSLIFPLFLGHTLSLVSTYLRVLI